MGSRLKKAVAALVVAGLLYLFVAYLVPWHVYWIAAGVIALLLALVESGGNRHGSSGRFLCDHCKYNYGDACTLPERPNATRCPEYRPSGNQTEYLWILILMAIAPISCKPSGESDLEAATPLARGPFVAEVTTSSVLIAWSTNSAGMGEVEYWKQTDGPGIPLMAGEPTPALSHAITLSGLEPATRYSYRILISGEILLSGRQFSTAPSASDPFLRFVVFGDSGNGSPEQAAVAQRIGTSDPDLAILAGDIIYPGGEPEFFDPHYFEPYRDLIDHIPFYTTLGNHDIVTENGQPYLEAFHLPHNNDQSTERYYSFDAGGAHFIALDSTQMVSDVSPMIAWLEEDLALPRRWKFVFFHHPLFSSGPHGSNLELRARLEPIFVDHGVDIVFTGHDHDYERTYPLARETLVDVDEEPNYVSPAGVIYVVTGGGGQSLYQKQDENSFTAYFESAHHLVQVDLADRILTLTAIRSDGVIMDSMTLSK